MPDDVVATDWGQHDVFNEMHLCGLKSMSLVGKTYLCNIVSTLRIVVIIGVHGANFLATTISSINQCV